jgi:hypothetical protein
MNAVENHLKESISKEYSDRVIIHGRVANLTEQKEEVHACIEIYAVEDVLFLVILAVIPQHYLTPRDRKFNSQIKFNCKNVIYDENLKKQLELS